MNSEELAEEELELEKKLEMMTERKKELLKSTRDIDQQVWKIVQCQAAARERLQQLREDRHRKEKWTEKARRAFEMEAELEELRCENRQLVETINQERSARKEELDSMKAELVAMKSKEAVMEDFHAVQREKAALRAQRDENARQISCMSEELESLRRLNDRLRTQLVSSEAVATELRLRQLDRLKCATAQTEELNCCHTGTAITHPVPDRVKRPFVIFDIRALLRSKLSARVPGCQKLQMTAQPGPAQDAL